MRPTIFSAAVFLALAFAVGSTARAQWVVPTSYSYSVAPNSNGNYYPDSSGSELIDSTLGLSFGNYSTESQAGAWTGWVNGTVPTISFQFDSAQTFSRIEIGTTRHDGAAVGLPSTITISGTTFNFTSGAMADDTRDWLVLEGTFFTTGGGNVLAVAFGSSYSSWLMLDEVRFTAIPEPANVAALLGAALAGATIVIRRRPRTVVS